MDGGHLSTGQVSLWGCWAVYIVVFVLTLGLILAILGGIMDGDTLIQLVTIIASVVTTIVSLLVRAKLIEQGRDISELKAQIQAQMRAVRKD